MFAHWIKDILKGIIIGTACIMPGISGGTLALSMGIYDKMISAVINMGRDLKAGIKILLPYVIGILAGILLLSFFIERLFLRFPLPANCLFAGLILGSVPPIYEKTGKEPVKKSYILAFAMTVVLVSVFSLTHGSQSRQVVLENSLFGSVQFFLVGIVASATLIIPGISGSMLLTLMGYYLPLIEKVNRFVNYALSFNIEKAWDSFLALLPFGLGVLIGAFIIARMIELLFKKAQTITYWGILGLVMASPVIIFFQCDWSTLTFTTGIASVLLFIIGMATAGKLAD